VLLDLFCYNNENHMQRDEFKFMLDKLCTAIANTLSIKKNYLHEIQKIFETKIIPQKDKIEIDELMKILSNCFSELSAKFEEF
jgi:hypothetical protein